MNTQNHIQALMAAQPISEISEDGEAPQWINLLPSGTQIATGDTRGPYFVNDPQSIIDASFSDCDRLPIDENHSIDLAAPNGGASPARGWITEMQSRADGIWGKVEWTGIGRDLVAGLSYRDISPVIVHCKDKIIQGIARASLTNTPNLKGLVSLNSQQQDTDMTFMQRMAKLLGLAEDASEDDIAKAVEQKIDDGAKDNDAVALQSSLTAIGAALGASGNDPDAILEAARGAKAQDNEQITALQASVTELQSTITTLQGTTATDKATAFVDDAIKAGRVGVKPVREQYISMHAKDPEGTEALINAMPILGPSGMTATPPNADGQTIALNAEQQILATTLGVDLEDYAKGLQAEEASQ